MFIRNRASCFVLRASKICLILCLMVSFSACQKSELYHELSEEDANEILVLLMQNQIDAKKVKEVHQNQISWTIQVQPAKLAAAREIMVQHNLPRAKERGICGEYSKPGLIPTPDEQKARFLCALKGEIINSLQGIPDVISADAVLNIPAADEFGSDKEPRRPTASVVVKVRPTEQAMANLTEAKLQRFIANSIEKLDPRDVAVLITYTAPPPQGVMPGQTLVLPSDVAKTTAKTTEPPKGPTVSIAGVEVSATSSGRLKLYIGLFLGLLAILSFGLVATVLQAVRMRREAEARGGEVAPTLTGKTEPPRLGPGV